jgi:hypothetical protein
MKPAQVNKLYAKLKPEEQAALVFEAAARLDSDEVDTILEYVERKTYFTVHADYHRRAFGLQWLVAQYGIEYWKIRALLLKACNKADDGDQQATDTAFLFLAKVVALEIALAEICKLIKVDMAAIKKMAGCPDGDAHPDELPPVDAELVRQYTDLYSHVTKV